MGKIAFMIAEKTFVVTFISKLATVAPSAPTTTIMIAGMLVIK